MALASPVKTTPPLRPCPRRTSSRPHGHVSRRRGGALEGRAAKVRVQPCAGEEERPEFWAVICPQGVGLWRSLRTRGRRPWALTDEFAANRRLQATERVAPRGRRGRRGRAAGDKARVAVGWMEAAVRLARRGAPAMS